MTNRRNQRGVTMFMALVMLVLLTLLAITAFNMGSSSLQIVGNFQHRNEALSAAQELIERALSTTRLITNPTTIFLAPCSPTTGVTVANANNCVTVDVNGDGTDDLTVQLNPQPTCVKAQVVPNAQLNFANPEDLACSVGPSQGTFGIGGVPTGNSLCTDSIWEVRAVASDNSTSTTLSVTEGAAIRVPNTTVATYCP